MQINVDFPKSFSWKAFVSGIPKNTTRPYIHTLAEALYRADLDLSAAYGVPQGAGIVSEHVTAVLLGLLTLGYWHSLTMPEVLDCIATKFLQVRCIC